jgi:predicted HD phosphohydrolase
MDTATDEQWAAVARAERERDVAGAVLDLLRMLAGVTEGFAVDQLEHSLQTAHRAESAGADDELVVAALCHDIGKIIPNSRHAAIAADLLAPYVRPDVAAVVRAHGVFQRRYTYRHQGGRPDARRRYRHERWYGLAVQFSDEWDQAAFDPTCATPALDAYEDRVRRVFSHPRYAADTHCSRLRQWTRGAVARVVH